MKEEPENHNQYQAGSNLNHMKTITVEFKMG